MIWLLPQRLARVCNSNWWSDGEWGEDGEKGDRWSGDGELEEGETDLREKVEKEECKMKEKEENGLKKSKKRASTTSSRRRKRRRIEGGKQQQRRIEFEAVKEANQEQEKDIGLNETNEALRDSLRSPQGEEFYISGATTAMQFFKLVTAFTLTWSLFISVCIDANSVTTHTHNSEESSPMRGSTAASTLP